MFKKMVGATISSACLLLVYGYVCARTLNEEVGDLGSNDPAVHQRASAALLASGRGAIASLKIGGTHTNPVVRRRCLKILKRLRDPEAFEVFESAALTDSNARVRQEAISGISRLAVKRSGKVLEQVLRTENDLANRISAIRNLSSIEGKRAIPVLRETLGDSNALVRLNAARELGRNGIADAYDLAVSFLKSADWRERAAAAEAVGAIARKDALPLLRALFENPKEERRVQFDAISAIRHIELMQLPPGMRVAHLDDALSHSDWAVRTWAAAELANRRDAESKAVLESAVAKKAHVGREQARGALAGFRDDLDRAWDR